MALPVLYSDIIDDILSFLPVSENLHRLLTFAFVSREWYHLSRRYSFAKLPGLFPNTLPALRELLKRGSAPNGGGSTELTFAQHVRRAVLHIDLSGADPDQWKDAKDIIMLMDRSFTTQFKLSIMLNSGVLRSSQLLDLKEWCANISTHLGLTNLWLYMSKKKLSQILCDESWASLTDLSCDQAFWNNNHDEREQEDTDNSLPAEGVTNPSTTKKLTVEHLRYFAEQHWYERFWPHDFDSGFETLVVKSLILRLNVDDSKASWAKASGLFKSIAANLVELDIARGLHQYPTTLEFNAAISGIVFPKLRTMKLGIMQGFVKSIQPGVGFEDSEYAFKCLLQSMRLPALETLMVSIANACDYLPTESTTDGRLTIGWDTLDGAMFHLAHPIDGGVTSEPTADITTTQARSNRFSKVVVAAWSEGWSGPKGASLIAYLKKKLHRCTSVGLEVDFEILYETDLD
ncbi:hypothetical protein BJ165DRAFT_1400513 [Panaeolus papilionaceus]|nr:hypothetical protein BJ165DRAFT_1400513 [Panaeolus papilionaceus]